MSQSCQVTNSDSTAGCLQPEMRIFSTSQFTFLVVESGCCQQRSQSQLTGLCCVTRGLRHSVRARRMRSRWVPAASPVCERPPPPVSPARASAPRRQPALCPLHCAPRGHSAQGSPGSPRTGDGVFLLTWEQEGRMGSAAVPSAYLQNHKTHSKCH